MSADTYEPKTVLEQPTVMPWAEDHARAIIVSGTILTGLLVVSTVAILVAFLAAGGR
ncbi:hypothetical protein [Microbacterium lacus]|uniref:hypothetical protein n=1 Tax=Microbacterium lacus TaxID=415217 RepID=UPI0018E236AD|nr:hypothetical protein [Microbacterium lacus]